MKSIVLVLSLFVAFAAISVMPASASGLIYKSGTISGFATGQINGEEASNMYVSYWFKCWQPFIGIDKTICFGSVIATLRTKSGSVLSFRDNLAIDEIDFSSNTINMNFTYDGLYPFSKYDPIMWGKPTLSNTMISATLDVNNKRIYSEAGIPAFDVSYKQIVGYPIFRLI